MFETDHFIQQIFCYFYIIAAFVKFLYINYNYFTPFEFFPLLLTNVFFFY